MTSHFTHAKSEHIILMIILAIIIFTMYNNRSSYHYMFRTILGRALMIFFIVFLTHFNVAVGLFATILILALQSSMNIEGLENNNDKPVLGISKDAVIPAKLPTDQAANDKTNASCPACPACPAPITAPTTAQKGSSTTTKSKANASSSAPVPDATLITEHKDSATKEGFSNMSINMGVDRIYAEHIVRSKPSKSLLSPFLGKSSEPSANWPDKDGYATLYAPIVHNQQYI